MRLRTRNGLAAVLVLAGCGLNERERLVADTNAHIRVVEEQGQAVAEAIAALTDLPAGPESFQGVIDSVRTYRAALDELNGLVERLGALDPEGLAPYVTAEFGPAALQAAEDCDGAVADLGREDATDAHWREALARVGRCIEHYGEAVDGVAREHAQRAR